MNWVPSLCIVAALLTIHSTPAQAQLTGHGGPVRSIAVSSDGDSVLSGSFDTAAIRWSLKSESAEQVLRFHSGAVNAVAFLKDGRMATAGADARIAIWMSGRQQQPDQIFEGHRGPIVALAVSPDSARLASASWDHTVRVWSLADGVQQVLEGHAQNVNGVVFTPDGRSLVSVGYDHELRIWPMAGGTPDVVVLPSPLNALTVAPGEIVTGGADGRVRFFTSEGQETGEVQAGATPIVALAMSADATLIAAAGIGGAVAVIDRKTRSIARTLGDPGSPVWSVAFVRDNATLLTGGADGKIRRWNARTGDSIGSSLQATPRDPLAAYAGDYGAEVFRACVACHTLSEKEVQRAGPTLAGLYGRRIASLPGYRFSDALKDMNIVWTPETVSKLFELGPNTYTPGTKMPEQRIGSAEDRKALTDFLARATSK